MNKGFTLIEVVVTVSIFSILIFGVSSMLNEILIKSKYHLAAMSNVDQARSVSNNFTNEIRNAVIGSDGSYPINKASDSEIIFFSNYRIAGSKIARIRYFVSGESLYKGIIISSGSPAVYNLSSESVTPVVDNLSDAGSIIFNYYNGEYDGEGDSLLQPVNINQIRYVKMNLSVIKGTNPNEETSFLISAGSAVRSVKDNLGN